jgi:hypothetical protein
MTLAIRTDFHGLFGRAADALFQARALVDKDPLAIQDADVVIDDFRSAAYDAACIYVPSLKAIPCRSFVDQSRVVTLAHEVFLAVERSIDEVAA